MSTAPTLYIIGFLMIWGLLFFSPLWIMLFRLVKRAFHSNGFYIRPIGEYGLMLTLVAITLVLGVISIYAIGTLVPTMTEGDLVWDTYDVTLYDNGTLTEKIVTDLTTSGEYRMLYRYWDDPLYYQSKAANNTYPCIEFDSWSVPAGTTGYAVDAGHRVFTNDSQQYAGFIGSLANDNEVGAYYPQYYDAGTYPMEFSYVLHPPVQYDDNNAHLNLKFFREHPAIRHVNITIYSDHVQAIYPHSGSLAVAKDGNKYTITGYSPQDELLEVEVLFDRGYIDGIPGKLIPTTDVKGKMEQANAWYSLSLGLFRALQYIAMALVVLMPFALVAVYLAFGREKKFTVPEYLSYVPNDHIKPWQANLLFKKRATDFDEDGLYGTMVDLYRRKMIDIKEKPDGKGQIITVLDTYSDDPYEAKVLGFLMEVGNNGVVDTGELDKLAKQARHNSAVASDLRRFYQSYVAVTGYKDEKLIDEYTHSWRMKLLPLFAIALLGFLASLGAGFILRNGQTWDTPLVAAIALFVVAAAQVIIAAAYPSTLFGYWKGDRFKEKLEWDAFAHFLSDLAMLEKYSPQDVSMWGEWLAYGTALGVGKNVEKAMEALHIDVQQARVPPHMGLAFAAMSTSMHAAGASSSSHGGGGGGR